MNECQSFKNIAIIAHIDHGKTTLLDALLRQSKIFRENQDMGERVMDSYDQEKERGITIFAKNTAVFYKETKINIIDTPGHSDFSGEVERVLGMVDTVLLLVDAQDGPMPQTRFVLSKALQMGLRPIVVLNKIDRPHADAHRVLDETFELFLELGATDEQLDFAYCYASGLSGFATRHLDDERTDMTPLFDMILEVPSKGVFNPTGSFLMQVATLQWDDYLGRQASGRILEGTVKKGDPLLLIDREGRQKKGSVVRLQGFLGLDKIEMEKAFAGDIVIIAGFPDALIGDTLSNPEVVRILPPIALEEPTVSVDFTVNSSPFVGKSGKHVTMNKIRDRLLKEKKMNISLKIEESANEQDKMTVSGRGELHLAVLMEAMRRENFEFSVSKPRVILKEENGELFEPIERVHIEVPEEFAGRVIEELSRKKGEMQLLSTNDHKISKIEFLIPTRGIMGFRNEFLTMTRGLGILTSLFDSFKPHKGAIPGRSRGVLISNCMGKTNGYACFNLQERSVLFVEPGDEVYEGMVVGENSRDNDLIANVIKSKPLTNVRASGSDENILLIPKRTFTLEQAIDYIGEDELVEITPTHIRMRKTILQEVDRNKRR